MSRTGRTSDDQSAPPRGRGRFVALVAIGVVAIGVVALLIAQPWTSGTTNTGHNATSTTGLVTTEPAEDTPAAPTGVTDEAQVAPPSPTEATTESAQEDTSAPTVAASPPQAPAADNTQTSAANPQTTPAGCSPAIDALGLCNRGFR